MAPRNRPARWVWRGQLLLAEAESLLNAEHQLSQGYATIEFDAPDELVVESDYGAWNDYLWDLFQGPSTWTVEQAPGEPIQACLPYVRGGVDPRHPTVARPRLGHA